MMKMKKKGIGNTFRWVHSLWEWKRKAGMKVPSRKRLKALARKCHYVYLKVELQKGAPL